MTCVPRRNRAAFAAALAAACWAAALSTGCGTGGGRAGAARQKQRATATLRVPAHPGARAGHVPAHVSDVRIDGERFRLDGAGRTFDLSPGPHEVTVGYERCQHGPSPLVSPGMPQTINVLAGRVQFTAEPGAEYVLGCTLSGVGSGGSIAHWVDLKLPGGGRRRVAGGAGGLGPDFPQSLLNDATRGGGGAPAAR